MKTLTLQRIAAALVLLVACTFPSAADPYFSATFDSGLQNDGIIPDGSLTGWSDSRTVSGSGVHHVSSVQLTLSVAGGYNGDLYAYLVHDNGMAVLLNRAGLCSTNAFAYPDTGLDVTFSSSATHNLHFYRELSPTLDGDGRLTGTWQPDARSLDPLSDPDQFDAAGTANFDAFLNQDPNGSWTLFVADVSAGGGTSTVLGWSLQIESVVEPPTHLVITSIQGGASPTAVSPFTVVVEARDINDTAANVTADTGISLSLHTGNGTLAGTLTGTLTNGTSSLTFTQVTYTRAESGVVLTASRTSGDSLSSAESALFTVVPGPFAGLQVLMPGESAAPGTTSGKTGTPAHQTVNSSFDVTVYAVDAHWNLIATNDTVALASSDADALLPSNAALSDGIGTFAFTFFNAGSQTVTASDVANPDIGDNTGTATTVDPGDQTITFGVLADQTYGVSPLSLTATSSSGLTVAFAVTSGPASVEGTSLTITGAGSVTVQATQSGNANWNEATPVSRTFDVATKPVTPAITALNKTYDGTTSATIDGRSLTGVVPGDDVNLTGGTATFASPSVGTSKVVTAVGLSLTGDNAGSYHLSPTFARANADITEAEVTVASGLTAVSKIYDSTPTASLSSNNVVLTGIVEADIAYAVLSTNGYSATFDSAAVGSGKTVTVTGLTLVGSAAGNYSLTQPILSADITPGSVVQLGFVTQPGDAAAGAPFGQQPVIHTRDVFGNDSVTDLGAHLDVTITITSGSGTLLGTTSLDIGTSGGNGVVSFADLRIDAAGFKQLTATAIGLDAASSDAFEVPNVAPAANLASFTRPRNVPLKILIADLLSNATDANGDPLVLASVSTSTNGATLRTNATYVLYTLPPDGNVADQFTYTVSDGTASTAGIARITLQANPTGMAANLVSYTVENGHPTIAFAGVPGYSYLIQRTQNLAGTPTWTDLTTTTAPPGGLFQYTDETPPEGSAFYRAIHP